MSVEVIYTNNNITIIEGERSQSFCSGDPQFDEYVRLWKVFNLNGIAELFNREKKLVEGSFKEFGFEVKDGLVYVNGKPVVTSIANRIKEFAKKNENPSRLVKFWEKLKKNPSYWCVENLFPFIDEHKNPIAPDGRFMAYKVVTRDFKDNYTKKIDNTPGVKVPPFPRNEVDDDKSKDCSLGYHVGSAKYVLDFGPQYVGLGARYIEVLVDPADVVSVPQDVAAEKIRVLTYEVVREIKREELNYEKFSGVYSKDESVKNDEADVDDDFNYSDYCYGCGEYSDSCTCCEDDYLDETYF